VSSPIEVLPRSCYPFPAYPALTFLDGEHHRLADSATGHPLSSPGLHGTGLDTEVVSESLLAQKLRSHELGSALSDLVKNRIGQFEGDWTLHIRRLTRCREGLKLCAQSP
jgi:hypothetical protein